MITINVDRQSEQGIVDSLRLMTLTKTKRRRILNEMGKASVKTSRQNQKSQQTPAGAAWQKRANKKRKKMQIRLASLLTVTASDENKVVIGWRQSPTAKVAARHHYGYRRRHTRASAIKALKNAKTEAKDAKGGATKEQARALKEEGFKVFARRINPNAQAGKMKSPTMRWIQHNLSAEQAGFILRDMRGQAPTASWETVLAPRPFLQVDKMQMRRIVTKELNSR